MSSTRFVVKALEKDRRRRYETTNGFSEDVRRFLKHEPVTAAAPAESVNSSKA